MHNRNTYRNHLEDSLSTDLNKNNEGGTTVGSTRGAGGHTSCAAAPVLSSTKTRTHTNEKKRKRRGCFFALLSLLVLLFIVGRMTSTSITNSTTGSDFLSKEKQHKHDDGNINTALQLSQIAKKDLNKTTKPAAAICTEKALFRRIPSSVRRLQYRRVVSAQEILAYIVQKLDNVGAPVTLMFGTLLHEYRNGTGPCFQANFQDKDLDIAVFAQHIPLIVALADDILKKFEWKLNYKNENENEKDKFLMFTPKGIRMVGTGYQIDVYGFECNSTPTKGLLYSQWQNASYAMNALLPFMKYKTIPYDNAKKVTNSEQHLQFIHMPYNPKCLLENLYGNDFMIPRKGRVNSDGGDPRHVYNRPKCEQLLSSAELKELERQLAFC